MTDLPLTDLSSTDSLAIAAPHANSNVQPDPNKVSDKSQVTIVGAGPAGALMSIFLAKRGYRVTVLERLPDLRQSKHSEGRSINLALADRGIHALQQAGAFERIKPLLLPMRGRMLHSIAGEQTFNPYGQGANEVIYSISRKQLNAALLDHAEREYQVDLRFRQTCISVDAAANAICLQDIPTGKLYSLEMRHMIGADGAGSVLRRFLVDSTGTHCTEDMLSHGYKELTIAADANGRHRLDPNALHVWPRGDFMLIALPNLDGTFTATLFLPLEGAIGFTHLAKGKNCAIFFREHFPDAAALLPDIEAQFAAHPTGSMGTVRCSNWTIADRLLLIGDAAHAIVPFHGQGMNCALEDCVEFDALLGEHRDWADACSEFQQVRKPNADAIADMALENYIEMRDTVRHPTFQLQKALSLELEQRFPRQFITRYSMVMFHHNIPYARAYQRGKIQSEILRELTINADSLNNINWASARQLIESRLTPL